MQVSIAILDSNGIDDVSGRENKHYYWNLSIDYTSNLKMILQATGQNCSQYFVNANATTNHCGSSILFLIENKEACFVFDFQCRNHCVTMLIEKYMFGLSKLQKKYT